MQIVRELGGYTLGRSDLLRRAMSKKKGDVMEKERQNFVYGNPQEGICGCISNGIDEKTANKIYDEMLDFAKYAFNKSHAAAYGVVSYQTAYLKCYYPVEFMAALMSSVIDNASKVAGYILNCRKMGIEILPPDVNYSASAFSVSDGKIRYALSAIKSIGRPIIQALVEERRVRGLFSSFRDFIIRMYDFGINKRVIEHLIQAGAFAPSWGTRKQLMTVYSSIMDSQQHEQKHTITGQMSLFDFASEEEKKEYQVIMPDVGEYDKETLLAFEKEVLGVYVSGHPLENYEEKMRKLITAVSTDFAVDEEQGTVLVTDQSHAVIGGMITAKTIKYTKKDQQMAFLTIEDLVGAVEVIVFPKDYEKNRSVLSVDEKVFIQGRVSAEEEKDAKLILEKVVPFEQTVRELWIQFETVAAYLEREKELQDAIKDSEGISLVKIYISTTRQQKVLPQNWNVSIDDELLRRLYEKFGEDNVKVVEKSIENSRKTY